MAMLAPNSARMRQIMAQEMARQGNIEGAIAHYREALKMDLRLPGLRFELAEALNLSTSAADQDEVEKEYRAALADNPFDEKAECRLGDIALRAADLQPPRRTTQGRCNCSPMTLRLTCISHRTLHVALWRRTFSLPRRLSSRRMDREPLQQRVSAGVPRRQPKRLRHEQLARCRLKGDEKSRLTWGWGRRLPS
jgi:tetratricopeptide (TPR) repeat protein